MITTMTKEEYLEGLGMPAPTFTHQFIINRINNNFVKRFPKSSYNFNCGMGICDNPEIIPDICLWEFVDKDNFETPPQNPLLEIEITHTKQNDKYSENSIKNAFKFVPSLQEAFLYNYTDKIWYRYKKINGQIIKEAKKDYSSILKCHLHTLLE